MDADVLIVGAGFAGLGLAIELERHGLGSFLILERASEVGGTWRDNTYPGCACDIPTTLYSFSFKRNTDWTRVFPRQPELLAYLKGCADDFGLRSRIRFNSELREARYDEANATWHVTTVDGQTLTSRILVSAMGPLNRLNIPAFAGLESFTGPAFHSGAWDTTTDLRDKRVAVIGTGASAIQIVPEIAPLVAHLDVFQRTPPWVIPRMDKAISAQEREKSHRFPAYAWLKRKLLYWMLEIRAYAFTVNTRLLQSQEELALRHLRRQVKDPILQQQLTPHYRMGCKRVLISDDYYPSLQRPNVAVISAPIERFSERAVHTADGVEHPVDVVVFATGFRATDGIAPIKIYGIGGSELGDVWRDGMRAYLGTSVAGFPNFFTIIGPNTGLGHNSMVLMMEAQYRYIIDALRYMKRERIRAIDVRARVQDAFNTRLQARMKHTVWASGCASWYIDARGKNTTLWPGFTFVYRFLTRRFQPDRYELTATKP
jgi:cation diffusion facilitator CzcD-associated flavoprotein CzcO